MTTQPLSRRDAIWANLAEWQRLWQMSRATTRLRDKVLVWLMPPEWRPADLGGPVEIPEVKRETQHKFEVNTPRPLNAYALFVFVTALAAGVIFLQWSGRFPLWLRVATCSHVVWALWSWAQVVEGRRSIWLYEGLRLLALVPLGLVMPESLRLVWVGFLVVQGAALASTALPALRTARPLSSN